MATSAGRVMPIPKGAYDASVTYNMLDMVRYNGSTYVCKQTCVGQTPADGAYWMLSAEGASGASVSSFNSRTGAVVPAKNDYDIGQIKPLTGATQGQVPVVNSNGEFEMGSPASSGHTIEDEYGTPMTTRASLQFTHGLEVTDDSTNGRTIVKVSDDVGHSIKNASGTTLTQRPVMKISGLLKATDDSTNQQTVISDEAEDISFADWDALSEEQQAEYSAGKKLNILDPPDCDGEVEIELMKLAWTNPNPTGNFSNQTITLDTDGDYDFIKVKFKIFYSDTNYFWREFKKGENGFVETADLPNLRFVRRAVNSTSDTQIQFGSGVIRDSYNSSGQAADDARVAVPLEIYVYKKKPTAKINAIATNVKATVDYSTSEHKIGKWIDGSDLYEKTVSCGALPNGTAKAVTHNISNIKQAIEIKTIAIREDGEVFRTFESFTSGAVVSYITKTNVTVSAPSGSSAYNECYVTLRYTKTS